MSTPTPRELLAVLVVVDPSRFADSSLGVDAIGSVTGFATIEGEDVAAVAASCLGSE